MVVFCCGRKTIQSEGRDVVASHTSTAPGTPGRHVMVAIGIDRYRHWRPLSNAVGDAVGAAALLRQLGFEDVVPPLLDDQATGEAIQALVTDELTSLQPDDNLIVFFAGHGGARTQRVGARDVRTGYLIPVDGAAESNRVQSWIEIDPWLRRISKLPPRHILVILDACFSGIALSSAVKWGRDSGALLDLPFAAANARPSRLVITSALDDERAMDSGPRPGHSLFTGCLIEALTGGVSPVGVRNGRPVIIGSELGRYVRYRVSTYGGRPGWQQTPDLGSFDFDERGEMLIPVLMGEDATAGPPAIARGSTEQIAARPETGPIAAAAALAHVTDAERKVDVATNPALAADTVGVEVAEIEAAAIDAMAGDVAAVDAAALAAMATISVGVGSSEPRTADPVAVGLEPASVGPELDHQQRSLTITVTVAVTVAMVVAILWWNADDRTQSAALPPGPVHLDPAAARPPLTDSAVDERVISPAAEPIHDPVPALSPGKPPGAAATVKRSGGATTKPVGKSPRIDRQPGAVPAPGARDQTASVPSPAANPLCPTWFSSPRGAEVSWNDVVATLPVQLSLPCNVEVTLKFRQANHLDATRKFTAKVDGEPVKVRLQRVPGPTQR
jgi:caspase domain-containing protein